MLPWRSYVDYVEVLGSQSLQASTLQGGVSSVTGNAHTRSLRVVYVPHTNAHGQDSFEYQGTDCAGDLFRDSPAGRVDVYISPINDVPTQ